MVHLGNDWDGILAGEFQQEYYKKIRYWLKKEYAEQTIYPTMEDIFNALRYPAYQDVKAVILLSRMHIWSRVEKGHSCGPSGLVGPWLVMATAASPRSFAAWTISVSVEKAWSVTLVCM